MARSIHAMHPTFNRQVLFRGGIAAQRSGLRGSGTLATPRAISTSDDYTKGGMGGPMSTFAGSGAHAAWPLQATMKCVDTVKDGTCSENDETPMFRNPSLWTPWVCLPWLSSTVCNRMIAGRQWANNHGRINMARVALIYGFARDPKRPRFAESGSIQV